MQVLDHHRQRLAPLIALVRVDKAGGVPAH
jgi:hypothetical protein